MAIPSQTLKAILQITKAFKSQLYDTLNDILDRFVDGLTYGLTDGLNDIFRRNQDSLDNMQEIFLMADIRDDYNQEIYAWFDFEVDCDDWYMDSCHLWDDNHFHILFDDSTPPFVENINVPHQELVMITNIHPAYSTMVLFLPD
jgi:hypothetical protein